MILPGEVGSGTLGFGRPPYGIHHLSDVHSIPYRFNGSVVYVAACVEIKVFPALASGGLLAVVQPDFVGGPGLEANKLKGFLAVKELWDFRGLGGEGASWVGSEEADCTEAVDYGPDDDVFGSELLDGLWREELSRHGRILVFVSLLMERWRVRKALSGKNW